MKSNKTFYISLIILGFMIFITGIILYPLVYDGSNSNIIGAFCGMGGAWIGIGFIKINLLKRSPDLIEEEILSETDERNVTIRGIASYRTYLFTLFLTCIIFFLFILMDYIIPAIIIAITFFLYFFYYIFQIKLLDKKM